MSPHLFTRAARAAGLVTLGLAVTAQVALARPEPGVKRRGFDLRASVFGVMNVNRVFCGINNLGEVCVDPTNSPVLGGGFWPSGTPDQYIFNSGLQLAGVIPADAGFDWAGDTTGVYFMDPRGDQGAGEGITLTYSSLDPADAADWPNGAIVRDAAIYNDVLLGRNTVSQQDVWLRTWDGNPAIGGGRSHPMGVLVEERGLAWNFPSGNQDIVYFIYTFYNITASNAAVYAGLDPAIRDEISAIGAQYQAGVQQRLGVDIPDDGYALTNLYAAFFMDPDVGDAGANYSSAILPFNMAIAYKSDFLQPDWEYAPEIFGAPFASNPGFVGVKYLKSPDDPANPGQEIGLTLFSNTLNQSDGFPDPVGVIQMWRYLSGNINTAAGDNPCTFPNPKDRRICFLFQEEADTRFYQSSGPFTLNPGQAATIVVAYIHAAPVAAPLAGKVGGDVKPGTPFPGDSIFADPGKVRVIDSIAGWLGFTDVNANQFVEQDEVRSVPRSLLDKALVAQAVFDNKFLLPFAPEPPSFFLVPGDNQVTVVWQRSPSEATGDPFFAIASDPTSPLYDPNFREIDVEGYRVYRGRGLDRLELVAQFDYAGTAFIDYTGGFDYGNQCAPELGIQGGCPADFNAGETNALDIAGNFVQVPPGGRVELADGSVFIVNADTAVTGGGEFPALANTGVPFAFIDRAVRNSFSYFYAVTAFDVNSFKSGPSSLESARIAKSVTPRAPSANPRIAEVVVATVTGDDGVGLDIAANFPAIDGADGTFGGLMPPVNAGLIEMASSAVREALEAGGVGTIRIDSVGLGWAGGFGDPPSLYVSFLTNGEVVGSTIVGLTIPTFNASGTNSFSVEAPVLPADSALAARFGGAGGGFTMPAQLSGEVVPMAFASQSVSTASGRYGVPGYETSRYLSHSRWFDFGGSEPADPTITAYPDSSHHAGDLTGVGRIWAPSGYRAANADVSVNLRGQGASGYTAWYPADFVVTWNADGSITVRDTTHHLTLPFTETGGSGWGFLTLSAVQATGMDQATWDDIVTDGVGTPAYDILNYQHLYMTQPTCTDTWWEIPDYCVTLSETAEVVPLDFDQPDAANPGERINRPDGTQDATGIVLAVNGEYFFMELNSLPAAGTRWWLRAVSGVMSASCTPALGPVMTDCNNYTFQGNSARPPIVPGLQFNLEIQDRATFDPTVASDLSGVHTVPDPYYVTNALEQTASTKILKFVKLPSQAIIRIYSVSGVLVAVVEHNDATGGGEATWNLRNRNNQFVASGVYFYHVETPDGQEKIGRFTVVNFAQ